MISVIVPVYKVEHYLHRCVDSILGQTYKDFDLILVDDGSPDSCGAICDEYTKQDPRVVVIHQKNGGLSAARNTGIDWAFANSDSQWLFFVDSDDFIHPKTLRTLLDAAEKQGTDISIGGFQRTPGDLPVVEDRDLVSRRWTSKDFFLQKNVEAVVAWGKLYRKTLFVDRRYPVGRIHEDEFTTYKLLFDRKEVAVVAAPLYGYYVNRSGIMGGSWSPRRIDAVDAFQERISYFEALGDADLLEYAIKSYVRNTAHQFEQAGAYPSQRKLLQKYLRKALRSYRPLFPKKEFAWIYSIAFPRWSHLMERVGLDDRAKG